MIERRIRLRRSRDVQRVYDEGRSWSHPLLVMIVLPNEVDISRVGVTASRSVGSAVERNRAKRLLREAARHFYPEFQSESLDIMLVARPKLVNANEREVEKALSTLLQRAGLLETQS